MSTSIVPSKTMTLLINKQDSLGYRIFKRTFDIVVSFLILLVLCIPLAIVALIIACLYKTNPIYKDERVGRGGKIIHVYKFKSMVDDANEHPEHYLSEVQMNQFRKERKVDNDPRVTKFGKFIRKTSIDEFPQFVNVLIGDLSIVGCRPITIDELMDNFTYEEQHIFLRYRPGITGNWQVYDRTEATWESGDRKKYIMFYIKHRCTGFDLKLFFLTIPACIRFALDKRSSNKYGSHKNEGNK